MKRSKTVNNIFNKITGCAIRKPVKYYTYCILVSVRPIIPNCLFIQSNIVKNAREDFQNRV
jgi:hypothetical protein